MNIRIYGNSNLAIDLKRIFLEHDHTVTQVSRSLSVFVKDYPDLIINTVGGQINDNVRTLRDLNIIRNGDLIDQYPLTPIITFSSNAALEPFRSNFGRNKLELEDTFAARIAIIRVCNLYGYHYPSRCFPYKLATNCTYKSHIELPQNIIIPTPTEWLAKEIYLRRNTFMRSAGVYNIAPQGYTRVYNWGKMICDNVTEGNFDESRPVHNFLVDEFVQPNWKDLWMKYNSPKLYGDLEIGSYNNAQMELFKQ